MEKKTNKQKKQNYVQETNKQNGGKKKKYKRTADIRCHKEFCTWEGRGKRKKKNAEVEHVNTKTASKLQTGGSKSH